MIAFFWFCCCLLLLFFFFFLHCKPKKLTDLSRKVFWIYKSNFSVSRSWCLFLIVYQLLHCWQRCLESQNFMISSLLKTASILRRSSPTPFGLLSRKPWQGQIDGIFRLFLLGGFQLPLGAKISWWLRVHKGWSFSRVFQSMCWKVSWTNAWIFRKSTENYWWLDLQRSKYLRCDIPLQKIYGDRKNRCHPL